jgi:hypothetical protein
MKSRIPPAKLLLGLALVLAAIPFFIGPNPFGSIDGFPVAQEELDRSRVVEFHGNRSSYAELRVETRSGKTFYYRDTDYGVPYRYLSQLPAGGPLEIRFSKEFDGLRILDIRRSGSVYIPFTETITESRRRFYFVVSAAGFFLVIGCLKLRAERKQMKPNQALEPTSTAVTPPADAGDRASGARGSP